MHHAKLVCPALLSLCAATGCSEPDPGFPDALETDGSTSVADTDASLPPSDDPPDTGAGTSTTGTEPTPVPTTGSVPEPPGSTGEPTDEGSTGMVELPCETQCIGRAPDGWHGPELLGELQGEHANVSCDGEFPTLGMLGYRNMSAPAASCDCDCGNASNVSCEGSVRVYRRGFTNSEFATCTGYIAGPYNASPGVVLDIPNVSSTPVTAWDTYYSDEPHIEGGSCESSSSESIQPAAFGLTVFTCGAELDATGCDADQWCQPPGVEASDHMCIWQPGSVSCPEGTEYTSRHLTYQGFTDTRSCSSCSCGDPTGSCEDTSVRLLSTQLFTHQAELDTSTDCDFVYGSDLGNYDISAVLFDPGDPVASCAPSGGDPTGTVDLNGAITVCCTP